MKVVNQVHQTYDYSIFETLKGNRIVNPLHVERLKMSFKKEYLLSPILVNEKHEIIDGQHRYTAAKDLNLPINFIIIYGYSLKEVQMLNTNMKNWTKEDYLEAYCDIGNEQYLAMKKFMEDFPELGLSASERLLTNNTAGSNNSEFAMNVNGKRGGRIRNFQEGLFKVSNLEAAYENAHKVMMFKPYYDGFNRATFVATCIGLFKNENYDHSKMIQKLSVNPHRMEHCINIGQYKMMIEDIYNYRSRDKVSLRF